MPERTTDHHTVVREVDSMNEHSRMQRFFNEPDLYLRENFNVATRCQIAKNLLGAVSHCHILDLGCGDGSLSLQFLPDDNRLTLVDASLPMLDRARSNTPEPFLKSVEYVHDDVLRFESTELYDVILCIGVLAHVPDTEALLATIASLLKPGGRCVLQFTDASRFLSKLLGWSLAVRRRLLLRRKETWEFTRSAFSDVLRLASQKHLRLLAAQHHLLFCPGMRSVLPGRWLARYDLFVLRHPALSKHGTEALLLFEKPMR